MMPVLFLEEMNALQNSHRQQWIGTNAKLAKELQVLINGGLI